MYGCTQVLGKWYGYCSERALKELEAQSKQLVESSARTAQLCGTRKYTTPVTFLVNGDGRRVMTACLSAICEPPATGKDELLRRVRNAIVLLSHADQIGSDPIALSLSFAAIEALVCEEHETPVNKQVKRHVATLLVQDADRRKAKERVINKLYDTRSKVLHGTQVHASSEASETVRTIAAGVIRAIACWRENQQRSGGDTSWKELMDELNAASRKPAIVVGVPDLSELIPDKDV
jgi:hypothetical protein